MQIATTSNLFLTGCPSLKVLADLHTVSRQGEFYQQVALGLIRGVNSKEALSRLGDRLITLAHHAYTFRRIDVVEQASQALMNLPLSHEYRSIGQYYYSFYIRREGQVTEARALLESLADEAPHKYRGRVIMYLAGLVFDTGDYKSALPLYVEAGRAASLKNTYDCLTVLTTQRMLAVLKSIDGDNRRAFADLENQFPLIRAASLWYPHEFYN